MIFCKQNCLKYLNFKVFKREYEWLDGHTVLNPETLPWKTIEEDRFPKFTGYQYWSRWNWSGLESTTLPEHRENIVCMSPDNERDYPKCAFDASDIMNTIGKENSERFKNLPFFADVYREMYEPTPKPIYTSNYFNVPIFYQYVPYQPTIEESSDDIFESGLHDSSRVSLGSGDGSGDGDFSVTFG